MAERKAKVSVVATAGTVDELPAKLQRNGRFDEIFLVSCQRPACARPSLPCVWIARQLDSTRFNLVVLTEDGDGFSGAEIEQTIVSALYDGTSNDATTNKSKLLNARKQTRPLSVLMQE
jgi:ATP-dependent 26S proteasome regulatory subunit